MPAEFVKAFNSVGSALMVNPAFPELNPSVPAVRGFGYTHDGSVATLEEMFDPDRLKDTHVPGGWRPLGSETHAIKGHEFGLRLEPTEREALIAFLRTL